jgi:Na+-transporting methylmalonyl-CoA/oxaloacetate decarboxylase gamma subunit
VRSLLIALTFAVSLTAAETPKPPVPFTKTEQLAAQVLTEQSQRLQRVIEEVTAEMCKRAVIERSRCEVDWQNGVVAEKVASKPEAVK